jgi:hypothetical protein
LHPIAIQPTEISHQACDLVGAVVTREHRVGITRFRKGQVLSAEDGPVLAQGTEPIHAVILEPDEVHEDEAGVRLAEMVRGDGVMQRDPVQSRVNMVATRKGLVRVNSDALLAINLRPEIGVFTVPDRLPVVAGKIIAGAKIAPVAIAAATLDAIAQELDALREPVIRVAPFLPIRAGVVVTEGLSEKIRDRFEAAVRQKIGWYGGDIVRFAYVADEAEAVAGAMHSLLAEGAEMLLAAGGHMMDPLDATQGALPLIGARLVRQGAPAHPGSLFWLGHLDEGDAPIVSLASCSMYSRSTVADLVLPRLMTGERVSCADIATIGYGGLLDRDMGWRFPPYDTESVDEPDEDE